MPSSSWRRPLKVRCKDRGNHQPDRRDPEAGLQQSCQEVEPPVRAHGREHAAPVTLRRARIFHHPPHHFLISSNPRLVGGIDLPPASRERTAGAVHSEEPHESPPGFHPESR